MENAKLIANVKELCERVPEVKYNYATLTLLYWFLYNTEAWNKGEFNYLASPESICRAYRQLIIRGSVQLDSEPRTSTEVHFTDNSQGKTYYEEEQSSNYSDGKVS